MHIFSWLEKSIMCLCVCVMYVFFLIQFLRVRVEEHTDPFYGILCFFSLRETVKIKQKISFLKTENALAETQGLCIHQIISD